jgi:hypothetical protein
VSFFSLYHQRLQIKPDSDLKNNNMPIGEARAVTDKTNSTGFVLFLEISNKTL